MFRMAAAAGLGHDSRVVKTLLGKLAGTPSRRHRLYGVMWWLFLITLWTRPQWFHGDPRRGAFAVLFLLGCAQFHIARLLDELSRRT
jgi:hypothetical protein